MIDFHKTLRQMVTIHVFISSQTTPMNNGYVPGILFFFGIIHSTNCNKIISKTKVTEIFESTFHCVPAFLL